MLKITVYWGLRTVDEVDITTFRNVRKYLKIEKNLHYTRLEFSATSLRQFQTSKDALHDYNTEYVHYKGT
jgi:hypothetical protein